MLGRVCEVSGPRATPRVSEDSERRVEITKRTPSALHLVNVRVNHLP